MSRVGRLQLRFRHMALFVMGTVIFFANVMMRPQDVSSTLNGTLTWNNRIDRFDISIKEEAWWSQRQQEILSQRPNSGVRRSDGPKKKRPRQHQFLEFDTSIVQDHNISHGNSSSSSSSSSIMVQVGRQGPAVKQAITHSFQQRRVGFPRKYFDIVATSKCLSDSNSSSLLDLSHRPKEFNKLPQAILIGVQKGGTTALYHYLELHPQVARSSKELYFLDEQIDEMVITNGGEGIPQRNAQDLYQRIMSQSFKTSVIPSKIRGSPTRRVPSPNKNASTLEDRMILDLTPHYIVESDRMPARVACIVPWVKLFVLLRNPIDRARSQYDMKMGPRKRKENYFGNPIPTFDEYIRYDIEALKETGVIQDWNKIPFDDFWDTPAMWEAWRTYLHSGLNAPVGMGLYALQLKPFLDLPNDLLVIRSEDLQTNTDATFQNVLTFLGLPPFRLPFYPSSNRARRREPISASTQALLQEVFEPFNRKLGELLGDEWKGVWIS